MKYYDELLEEFYCDLDFHFQDFIYTTDEEFSLKDDPVSSIEIIGDIGTSGTNDIGVSFTAKFKLTLFYDSQFTHKIDIHSLDVNYDPEYDEIEPVSSILTQKHIDSAKDDINSFLSDYGNDMIETLHKEKFKELRSFIMSKKKKNVFFYDKRGVIIGKEFGF